MDEKKMRKLINKIINIFGDDKRSNTITKDKAGESTQPIQHTDTHTHTQHAWEGTHGQGHAAYLALGHCATGELLARTVNVKPRKIPIHHR